MSEPFNKWLELHYPTLEPTSPKEETVTKSYDIPRVDEVAYREAMIDLALEHNVPITKLNEVLHTLGLDLYNKLYNVEIKLSQTYYVQVVADTEEEAIQVMYESGGEWVHGYSDSRDWFVEHTGHVVALSE